MAPGRRGAPLPFDGGQIRRAPRHRRGHEAMRRRPRTLPAGLLALAAITWAAAGTAAAAVSPGPAGGTSWTVYHDSPAGTGVAPDVASVDTTTRAWTSPALDGEIYGEPLVFDGRVFVATENDTVYALNASNGATVWSTHLGTPVPSTDLPCGDITPTVGITGTPVIDPSRREIFVVADELVNGAPAHVLTGLDTASGKTELTQHVDPAGVNTAALLQRTGLTLDDGRVIFGMGGNFGDCSAYKGRVIAAPETGGKAITFTVDAAAGESQGAIWMGGAAPVVDGGGHVWVAAGNGSVYSYSHAYDDSDSVLELSPTMRLLQYFAPSNWPVNNSQDLDMSTAPVLLPDGQVILTGKSRIVYLLDGAHLGGIGHQQASLAGACPEDIDGGIAIVGMTVYLPCRTGIIAVAATRSPPALHLLWSSGTGRRPGDRRRRAGVDHRPERHAVRAQPGHREDPAAGVDRRGGQPLPHPHRGRRPHAGPGRERRGRVHRVRLRRARAGDAAGHSQQGGAGQPGQPLPERPASGSAPTASPTSWPAGRW